MNGGIGHSISRIDGREKVTGRARYTADTPIDGVLHAVIVAASKPKARVVGFDFSKAEANPGVARIFTHLNSPPLSSVKDYVLVSQHLLPLQSDQVVHEGQPVALVVADTLERAIEAARLVHVYYEVEPFSADFAAGLANAEVAPAFFDIPPIKSIGDVEAAWSQAEFKVRGEYATSDRHHNPIELSCTIAIWNAGSLLVYDSTQGVVDTRNVLARALQIDPAYVRVVNEFVGGGFGCKQFGWPHQYLAAMAAREIGRPVKLTLTRSQAFTAHGYQPATRQTISFSARADGALTSLRHDTIVAASHANDYVEGAGWETPPVYASPSIMTTHRIVRLDRSAPWAMRAPIGGVGMVSVEIAMDELAYALGMDPLVLRLKNYATVVPGDGRAFSSKRLRECYESAAARFSWERRVQTPRSLRIGRDLVGYGMATAILPAYRWPARARVSIDRAGQVLVETSSQEIGTGMRTTLCQIAADALGVSIDRVKVALGDTDLPPAPINGASTGTMSAGSAVHAAASSLRAKLREEGAADPMDYVRALADLRTGERFSAEGEWAPDAAAKAIYSFGAIFVEVRIDEEIPIPRVTRIVATYSAGRIINPRTARSQMTGGLIWGIGQALLERSETDTRLGRFVSKNLSGYLVPVNADAPDIDVSFVEDVDTDASPIGARGIGELGAIGIAAAIANAVFHATGVRVREIPIRPEHLL